LVRGVHLVLGAGWHQVAMAMGEGWFGWNILFVQSKLRNKGWFVAGVFMARG